MSRVENLPENNFVQELQYIRDELDNIKKRQLTGDDNLLTYFVRASPDITMGGITAFQDKSWYVYFYPNSGTRTYNYMEVSGAVTNGTGFEFWSWAPAPQFINELGFAVWKLYFFNDSNTVSVNFKVGFRAIEQGVVQWVAI